jgi:hypothetical protein
MGRPISTADAQIAAICREHSATLAIRNTGDFTDTTLLAALAAEFDRPVLDPWQADRRVPKEPVD